MNGEKGKVYLGADPGGYDIKEYLRTSLEEKGYMTVDLGVFDIEEQADYTDIAREVGEKVIENGGPNADHNHGPITLGILTSGTGTGMMIAANKMKGIRACAVHTVEAAKNAREQFDSNILCLGADMGSIDQFEPVIDAFISTKFCGEEGCKRNIEKM